jgi:ATP-dependent protease ClpP protease subunit
MKNSIDFFKKLSDKDFYSNKLKHLYITGSIDSNNIDKLIEDVRNANKEPNPKPILIHISSIGGNLVDGIKLLSIFKISSLPIATIIDNYCFSIATILLINSPYRLMNKNSFCLLHEYSIDGYINNNRQNILNFINKIDIYFKSIIDIYLKKTLFTKEELHDLLEHNLLLDYKYCLKKGIVDRIIDYEYKLSYDIPKYNITEVLKDININNLNINCKMTNEEIDNIISKIDSNNSTIIYTTFINCYSDKDDKKENNQQNDDNNNKSLMLMYNSLNLISKIKTINTYKFGIIDVPISIEYLIPLLYTNKIIMYSHSYIICNLLYSFQNYSLLLDDNIKNTKIIINNIKDILKQKTKMPKDFINNIDKKFNIIDAKKAKEFGLCTEIIDS